MSAQGRVGDKGNVQVDAHGCPACPHPAIGPAIIGSPDVLTNGLPSLRVDDFGLHAVCCNTNTWVATKGAQTVFINNKPAHRKNDAQRHCGGDGKLVEGSPNVMVEDSTGGGGAGGAGGGSAGGGGAGGGAAGGTGGGAAGGNEGGNNANGGSESDQAAAAGGSPVANDTPDVAIEPDEIEVRVVSAVGDPVDGIRYELTMPSGAVVTGTADVHGVIKLTGLRERGDCTIRFPSVDDERSGQP
jgi:hypothetical protein